MYCNSQYCQWRRICCNVYCGAYFTPACGYTCEKQDTLYTAKLRIVDRNTGTQDEMSKNVKRGQTLTLVVIRTLDPLYTMCPSQAERRKLHFSAQSWIGSCRKTSAQHVREVSPCHSPRDVCIRDEFVFSHYILVRRK